MTTTQLVVGQAVTLALDLPLVALATVGTSRWGRPFLLPALRGDEAAATGFSRLHGTGVGLVGLATALLSLPGVERQGYATPAPSDDLVLAVAKGVGTTAVVLALVLGFSALLLVTWAKAGRDPRPHPAPVPPDRGVGPPPPPATTGPFVAPGAPRW